VARAVRDGYILHTLSYTINLGYITFEAKLTAGWQIIVGCWVLCSSEVHMTGKAGFMTIKISHLGLNEWTVILLKISRSFI
jgi:hypothetical protein